MTGRTVGLFPEVGNEDGIMLPGVELGVIPHWSFREGSNEDVFIELG